MAHHFDSGFFSQNRPAWHGLGKVIPADITAEQAIKLSGLDWQIDNLPCYDEHGKELPNFIRRIVRMDDHRTLGKCAADYQPIQNCELFQMAQALISEGVTFETAGSLKQGQFVWALVHLGRNNIKDDVTETYMLVYNWHNAKARMKVLLTDVRVVCWNTLSVHLGKEGQNVISISHVGNVAEKIETAKRIMEQAGRWREKFLTVAEKLAEVNVDGRFAKKIAERIFPEKKNKKLEDINVEKRDAIVQIFMHQKESNIIAARDTAWGMLNAVTDFVDHRLFGIKNNVKNDYKKRESHMLNVLLTNGAKIKDAAFEAILEETGAELDVQVPATFSVN